MGYYVSLHIYSNMAPRMWGHTNTHQSHAAKYKRLKTGILDPSLTSATNYSNIARNTMIFRRYPILVLKNPNNGVADIVISASVKATYVQRQLTTKIFCIQYIR